MLHQTFPTEGQCISDDEHPDEATIAFAGSHSAEVPISNEPLSNGAVITALKSTFLISASHSQTTHVVDVRSGADVKGRDIEAGAKKRKGGVRNAGCLPKSFM